MKFFYDCEFVERGSLYPVELISIGIVAEDGREYYAQSSYFDWDSASLWVREHVYPSLLVCSATDQTGKSAANIKLSKVYHMGIPYVGYDGKCSSPTCPWRSRLQLAADILAFMDIGTYGTPELVGYYAAYDHVAFCQIFGTMIDLPAGFPMYTRDIKQMCDDIGSLHLPIQGKGEHQALFDARWTKAAYEYIQGKEKNERLSEP